jgi:outer membrane receptor for ferrienterochelin and colicin
MIRTVWCCLFALVVAALLPNAAWAGKSATTPVLSQIDGVVVDQNGLPIAKAVVVLFRGQLQIGNTTTNPQGRYTFAAQPPGIYHVDIAALGYETVRTNDITLSGATVFVTTVISQQRTRTQSPRQIGTITVNSGTTGLQSTTVIQSSISANLVAAVSYSRAGDALVTLPAINPSPNGVHGSTIGYSLPLDIRGIGSNETQVLFDGHPVGAMGANAFPGQAFFNQAPVLFDFQNSPSDAVRNYQVTYGSGAVGLYGVDSIGGVIDEQSIDPTPDQRLSFTQGFGSYGKSLTNFEATGTFPDKLGYAIASGVTGTFGEFPPGLQTQVGLTGTDQTSANLKANTYFVSGDYLQRDTLGKLFYPISGATKITLTGYSANSWSDKSGEGDDDYVTYPYQLLVGEGIIEGAPGGITSIVGANGVTLSCKGAIAALNNANPNGFCETPSQFAAATTGPQGGGNGPWQALRTDDYHARLTTTLGSQNFAFDTFVDNFGGIYSRTANLLGSAHQNIVVTRGLLLSDSMALGVTDDLGFGYYSQVQKITGSNQDLTTNALGNPYLVPTTNPEVAANISNFFIRDAYKPNGYLGIYFNGWAKYNSVSRSTAFDPRLSIVVNPTNHDVVRLTGGRSTDAPFIGLQAQQTEFNNDTTNIQPACGGLTIVGSSGNPDIQSVTGTDVELAYGHRFQQDTSVQLAFYNTTVQNPIFDSTIPATVYSGNPGLASLIAALNGTPSNPGRYEQICNLPATPNNLGLSGPVNLGGGAFRGANLSGRVRLTPQLHVDYGYNLQVAEFTGISASLLQTNPFLINNAQIAGIPPQTGMLAVDYSNAPGRNEFGLDANYVSANNSYWIGNYAYVNAFVRQALTQHLTLNVGGYNIFNAYSDRYGLIGWGRFQPENQYFNDKTVAEQAYYQGLPENIGEGFGIPPPQITVSITVR